MADKPTQCGALWRKLAKDGKTRYFSGVFEQEGQDKVFFKAFINSYKEEGSNQPDYRLILDVPLETQTQEVKKTASAPKAAAKAPVKKVVAKKAPAPVEEVEEEVEQEEEVLLD